MNRTWTAAGTLLLALALVAPAWMGQAAQPPFASAGSTRAPDPPFHGPRSVTHTVEVRNFAYEPREVLVSPGDTVVYTNRDIFTHTVSDDARAWDSGGIAPERSWRLVVRGPAAYHCAFHPSMKGSLVLR